MRSLFIPALLLIVWLSHGPTTAASMTRAEAIAALDQPDAGTRRAGVERLGDIGQGADADRLLPRLADGDPAVRQFAAAAMWQIWSRSGDKTIDTLFERGLEQMQASQFDQALLTFDTIVQRKPDFAEGWNKRATLYFLMGENEKSLKDCDEVLERNRNHFGALSGAGQIHLQLGNPERALEFFRRAVRVNPNLEGPAAMIPMLEQHLRDRGRST